MTRVGPRRLVRSWSPQLGETPTVWKSMTPPSRERSVTLSSEAGRTVSQLRCRALALPN